MQALIASRARVCEGKHNVAASALRTAAEPAKASQSDVTSVEAWCGILPTNLSKVWKAFGFVLECFFRYLKCGHVKFLRNEAPKVVSLPLRQNFT